LRRRAKPSPPAKRLTVSIGEIGARGDGVAHADGREIFVPLTAPGDVALIEARGERGCLIELIEQSPNRVAPPCPHYGACGGCALQHVDEVFYRAWKRERVIEALARAGLGDVPVNDLVATPPATRRRATFAVRRLKGGVVLGFNERQSSNIVDLKKCLILHPDLLARLSGLRALAASLGAPSFDLAVTLCRNGLDIDITGARMEEPRGAALLKITDVAMAAGCVRICINGEALITFEPPLIDFDGVAVTPPPGAFLQASKEGEAALIGLVKKGVGGARKICDLFAGCGSFALPLAKVLRSPPMTATPAQSARFRQGQRTRSARGLLSIRSAQKRGTFSSGPFRWMSFPVSTPPFLTRRGPARARRRKRWLLPACRSSSACRAIPRHSRATRRFWSQADTALRR